jgi:hypothetical protein
VIKDEDLKALAEAVLESKDAGWVHLVREIREIEYVDLREGIRMAKHALELVGTLEARAMLHQIQRSGAR